MGTKIGIYHGNEIHCDVQNDGEFYVSGDDAPQKNLRDTSLKGLYRKIDNARKVKFNEIPCYTKRYSSDVHKGRITSTFAGRDGRDPEHMARFVGEGGQPRIELGQSWGKQNWKDEAYPINAHNNRIAEEMEVLDIAIKDLEDERKKLLENLQTFSDLEEKKAERKTKKEVAKS